MFSKINSQTTINSVTLSEVKAQCRLTSSFTLDDARLSSLIEVCNSLAQTYTNRLLSVGVVSLQWDTYRRVIPLYGGDVTSITSLTAYNQYGVEVVIPAEDYRLDVVSGRLVVSTDYVGYEEFTATYSCGYSVVPKQVKQAILLMVATMYNSTEDVVVGQTVESLPYTATTLLDSVKVYHET